MFSNITTQLKQSLEEGVEDSHLISKYVKNEMILKEFDEDGYSILYYILKFKRESLAISLIEEYPCIVDTLIAEKNKETLLYVAAQEGLISVIDKLLIAGAEINIVSQDGKTPLHIAARVGNVDVVNMLIKAGADKDKADSLGYTPLHVAIFEGQVGIVNRLIGEGADTNKATETGGTPLHIATEIGNTDVVNVLIKARADIDRVDNGGYTPLYAAAELNEVDIAKALITSDADKDKADSGGYTPLHSAARFGAVDVLNMLIQAGGDKNKVGKLGETPLYLAVFGGHVDAVNTLIKAGVDKDVANKDGFTPLSVAAYHGKKDIVYTLLAAGADIDKAVKDGCTPLFYAASKGYFDIVRALLAFGADCTLTSRGVTLLQEASRGSHEKVVKALAEHPDIKLETLQKLYLYDNDSSQEIKDILIEEVDLRIEKAETDAVCQMALEFWPKCPIYGDYMIVPVRAEDNHIYERKAIEVCFERNELSPMTREVISTRLSTDLLAIDCIDKVRGLVDNFYKKQKTVEWKSEYDAIKAGIVAEYQKSKQELSSINRSQTFFAPQCLDQQGGEGVAPETPSAYQ